MPPAPIAPARLSNEIEPLDAFINGLALRAILEMGGVSTVAILVAPLLLLATMWRFGRKWLTPSPAHQTHG